MRLTDIITNEDTRRNESLKAVEKSAIKDSLHPSGLLKDFGEAVPGVPVLLLVLPCLHHHLSSNSSEWKC